MRVCQFRHFGTGGNECDTQLAVQEADLLYRRSRKLSNRCSLFALRFGFCQNKPGSLKRKAIGEQRISSACRFSRFADTVRAILFQLIVQGLKANAENVGSPRLIIIGRFQRL